MGPALVESFFRQRDSTLAVARFAEGTGLWLRCLLAEAANVAERHLAPSFCCPCRLRIALCQEHTNDKAQGARGSVATREVRLGGKVGFTLKIGGVFPQYMYLNGVFLCICVVL